MKKYFMQLLVFCAVFMLTGCGDNSVQTGNLRSYEESVQVSGDLAPVLADSLDRAVVQKVDETNQAISFYNLALGKSYTLTYDNATGIKSRHGEELVAGQLQPGDVVDVTFVKDTKQAKNIWLEETVAVTENVTNFKINRAAKTFEMNGEKYSIDEHAPVLAGGEVLELMDINEVDTLRVSAIDHTVYSIAISNGHGYVRLLNAEFFEGGWVEFGQRIIRKVEKDMLLVVPAGSYEMLISNQGTEGSKELLVNANEETQVDVSEFIKVEEGKTGGIIFTITPSDAVLEIDGEEVDYSSVVSLSYGIHQLKVTAEGYKTISQYIKVGEEMANINIAMEEADSDSDSEEDSDNDSDDDNDSVSGNSVVTATGEGYKVYIDAPEGAELYVNGKYIGILPTSFDKKSGTYTVSVRRSGYATRSYTLEVDGSDKDVRYSFSDLEKSEKSD